MFFQEVKIISFEKSMHFFFFRFLYNFILNLPQLIHFLEI